LWSSSIVAGGCKLHRIIHSIILRTLIPTIVDPHVNGKHEGLTTQEERKRK
jgi:hypothetical protein